VSKALDDIPHFQITDELLNTPYGESGFLGRFDQVGGVIETVSWLRVSKEKFSKGSLHALDLDKKSAIFVPWEGKSYLAVGMTLPWIDAFWKNSDIEMVADTNWPWKRVRFSPKNALRIDADVCGGMLCKAPEGEGAAPAGATLVPKGWDHEHCRFCWEKIGIGGAAHGFTDDGGTWLCENCYRSFVVPHDLSYMEIHGKRWPTPNH
jgi:hypothetical protein